MICIRQKHFQHLNVIGAKKRIKGTYFIILGKFHDCPISSVSIFYDMKSADMQKNRLFSEPISHQELASASVVISATAEQ